MKAHYNAIKEVITTESLIGAKNGNFGVMSKLKIAYPAKVLIAWAEAISGNVKLRDWLLTSEYKELGIFCFAMVGKRDAKKWFTEHQFPHLLALINACEGDEKALEWLKFQKLDVLYNIGLVVWDETEGLKWLTDGDHFELAMVAKKLKDIFDELNFDRNDVHKFGG